MLPIACVTVGFGLKCQLFRFCGVRKVLRASEHLMEGVDAVIVCMVFFWFGGIIPTASYSGFRACQQLFLLFFLKSKDFSG
jgi:hypothetical protein